MPFTTPALNAGVAGIAAAGRYISAHTADPGTTGASEVTGGSYARQPTTWATAGATSAGTDVGSQVSIPIPAKTSVTHWGVWSAVTAGTLLYSGPLSDVEAFGAAGLLQHTPTLQVSNPA